MKKLKIIFILLFFTNLCFPKENIEKKDSISPIKVDKFDNQEATYKMLYENQIDANDDILKTIFYALGGLGTAMFFVFASNWWFNEKKVADIKKGIQSDIENEVNKVKNDIKEDFNTNIKSINKSFSDFTENIRKEIREDNNNLLTNFQSQFESFTDNINIQISTLKSSFDERIEVVQKELEINNVETIKTIAAIQERLDRTEKRLKINILGNDAELWLLRGVPVNSLNCYIEEGEISLQIGYDWNIEYVMKDLERILEKLTWIRPKDIKKCETFFDKIPSAEFEPQKKKILDGFKKLELEPDPE